MIIENSIESPTTFDSSTMKLAYPLFRLFSHLKQYKIEKIPFLQPYNSPNYHIVEPPLDTNNHAFLLYAVWNTR